MKLKIKRYYVIAPNGDKCSVVEAGSCNLQTWSGRRMRWESFSKRLCEVIGVA